MNKILDLKGCFSDKLSIRETSFFALAFFIYLN